MGHGQRNGAQKTNVERFKSNALRKIFLWGAAAPTRPVAGFPREYFKQENDGNHTTRRNCKATILH
jgi:hypothetical protein